MIRSACQSAEVAPGDIGYVEAHGTGTAVGDPIETAALGAALGEGQNDACLIGSVKTNIGHLEAASGIASLIKVALVLKHRADSAQSALPHAESADRLRGTEAARGGPDWRRFPSGTAGQACGDQLLRLRRRQRARDSGARRRNRTATVGRRRRWTGWCCPWRRTAMRRCGRRPQTTAVCTRRTIATHARCAARRPRGVPVSRTGSCAWATRAANWRRGCASLPRARLRRRS